MGMGDEFRRRVRERLAASGQPPSALSKQAGLSVNTVREMLEHPGRGIRPETVKGIARALNWSEREALAWAQISSPSPDSDPLGDIQSALQRGGWPAAVYDALYTLAEATQRTPVDAQCEAAFTRAVDRLLQQRVAAHSEDWPDEDVIEAMTGMLGDFFREELATNRT